MPAERFYVDAQLTGTVTLEGQEFHHLAHVMRIGVGETIELVDGRGSLAQGKVRALSKQQAQIEILQATQTPLSPPRLILAIPLLRPSKLELIVEKGTELGADAFWLYPAAHSEKDSLSPNQMERLAHIALSAMKQCGRLDLPPLQLFSSLAELLQQDAATYLFGDTKPGAKELTSSPGKTVFITGPEKGFTEKEQKLLTQKATGVRLHKNILRAETAPLAALCKLY